MELSEVGPVLSLIAILVKEGDVVYHFQEGICCEEF